MHVANGSVRRKKKKKTHSSRIIFSHPYNYQHFCIFERKKKIKYFKIIKKITREWWSFTHKNSFKKHKCILHGLLIELFAWNYNAAFIKFNYMHFNNMLHKLKEKFFGFFFLFFNLIYDMICIIYLHTVWYSRRNNDQKKMNSKIKKLLGRNIFQFDIQFGFCFFFLVFTIFLPLIIFIDTMRVECIVYF